MRGGVKREAMLLRRALLATRARRFSTAAPPSLKELVIADDASAWQACGFAVSPNDGSDADADTSFPRPYEGGLSSVGGVRLQLLGAGRTRGALSWSWYRDGEPRVVLVDGIPTALTDAAPAADPAPHPNGASRLYSITLATSHLERTKAALEAAGAPLRRVLDPAPFSEQISMALFRLGPTLVEVVAPREPGETVELPGLPPLDLRLDAPAKIVGVVPEVPDLAPLQNLLGDNLGKPRPAMQGEGRQIATVRHEKVGLSLTMAFLTSKSK